MNNKSLKNYGSKVVPYKKLPWPHQMAIAHYMAIDGGAWEMTIGISRVVHSSDIKRQLRKALPFYIKKYGQCKFGVVEIPTKIMEKELMKIQSIKGEFPTFGAFQKWYSKDTLIPRHTRKNRWPCILSTLDNGEIQEELVEDGWHRLARYWQAKHETIPCVYYLKDEDYCYQKFA